MIVVEAVFQTCEACPSQWEAKTSDGRFLYIRFRWGCLTIGSGATIDEAVERFADVVEFELSDGLDGFLSFAQLCAATAHLIQWPEREQTVIEAAEWNEDARDALRWISERA